MFKKSSRVLLVTLLLFVLAGSTYAFAATNTVDATFAGDGSGTISGYHVSGITYSTAGGNITGVTFTLDYSASVVQASLNGGTLSDCVESSTVSNSWSCSLSGVSVADAASLRVVAVQ